MILGVLLGLLLGAANVLFLARRYSPAFSIARLPRSDSTNSVVALR